MVLVVFPSILFAGDCGNHLVVVMASLDLTSYLSAFMNK